MQMLTIPERAGRELELAAKRLRADRLSTEDLDRTVERVRRLAAEAEDDADRIEIEAAAEALKQLPDALAMERVCGPVESSKVVALVERLVAWAWEDLPTLDARIERVRAAVRRIEQLPTPTIVEEHVLRTQRADLLDLLAALEARKR
jgi:hypothetical protein